METTQTTCRSLADFMPDVKGVVAVYAGMQVGPMLGVTGISEGSIVFKSFCCSGLNAFYFAATIPWPHPHPIEVSPNMKYPVCFV